MRGFVLMMAALGLAASPSGAEPGGAGADASSGAPASAHAFRFDGISGGEMGLDAYAGQVVLVVNTASRCGYTGQYDSLQAAYEQYGEQGLVVLGVPSDSFNQELASEEDVKDFCAVNFNLTFPMTAITPVKGDESHPFFSWVRESTGQNGFPGWNFNKVLLDRDGAVVATFGSGNIVRRNRLQPELVTAIEQTLGADAA